MCVCVFVYCKRNRVNLKEGQRPKKEECMWKRERQSGERGRISLAAYKVLRASHFRQKWILAVRNDDNTLIKHLKLRNLSVVFVGTLRSHSSHFNRRCSHCVHFVLFIQFTFLFQFVLTGVASITGKERITEMFTTNWVSLSWSI